MRNNGKISQEEVLNHHSPTKVGFYLLNLRISWENGLALGEKRMKSSQSYRACRISYFTPSVLGETSRHFLLFLQYWHHRFFFYLYVHTMFGSFLEIFLL
jgi:hypothetical protein